MISRASGSQAPEFDSSSGCFSMARVCSHHAARQTSNTGTLPCCNVWGLGILHLKQGRALICILMGLMQPLIEDLPFGKLVLFAPLGALSLSHSMIGQSRPIWESTSGNVSHGHGSFWLLEFPRSASANFKDRAAICVWYNCHNAGHFETTGNRESGELVTAENAVKYRTCVTWWNNSRFIRRSEGSAHPRR